MNERTYDFIDRVTLAKMLVDDVSQVELLLSSSAINLNPYLFAGTSRNFGRTEYLRKNNLFYRRDAGVYLGF